MSPCFAITTHYRLDRLTFAVKEAWPNTT